MSLPETIHWLCPVLDTARLPVPLPSLPVKRPLLTSGSWNPSNNCRQLRSPGERNGPIRTPLLFQVPRQKRHSGMCPRRSEEHTSELQSRENLVCRLLLEKKKKTN